MTFPLPPREAVIYAEFVRLLDAREVDEVPARALHTTGAFFNEHRNTSRVFPVTLDDQDAARVALAEYRAAVEEAQPSLFDNDERAA